MEKANLRALLPCVSALALWGGPAFAANEEVSPATLQEYQAVQLEAGHIPTASGMAIDSLSLAAVVDGVLEPIPFQIDEYNVGGGVYFEHGAVALDGAPEIFDAHDKLLFIVGDAGAKKTPDMAYDGQFLAEIRLGNTPQTERYIYLVKNSRLRSDVQHVRYRSDEALVETDFFSLQFDRDNLINWDNFEFYGYDGESPLDSMKVRFKTGILSSLTATEMDNHNFIARAVGDRAGAISTISQWNVDLYWGGLPLMQASIQMHAYPKSLIFDCRIAMPEVRRSMLVNPQMSFTVDGHQLTGAKVRTSASPVTVTVDGKLGEEEKKLQNVRLHPEQNWIWMSTGKQFDTVWFYDDIGGIREPISLNYRDDATLAETPERFPGQTPGIGHTILQFPRTGVFGFVSSMYFEPGFGAMQPEQFTAALRNQPDIRVIPMK